MERKNYLLALMAFTSLVSILSCGGDTSSSIEDSSKDSSINLESTSNKSGETIELLPDNHFENGFIAYPGTRSYSDGTYPENDWNANVYLKYDENTPNPSWQVQQIGCVNDLNDIYNPRTNKYPDYEEPYYKFEGVSNYVYVDPNNGEIILGLNASKDYDQPRTSGDWCHLLLQNVLTNSVKVSELQSLNFSIDLELQCENKMSDAEYNPSIHTAQFLLYFIVQSNATLDAGDYFWFGIPFYDYRYTSMDENIMIDNRSQMPIYQMSNRVIDPEGIKLNKEYKINLDLIELFSDALLACQNSLDRFLNSTINDFSITSMNIGWELPGTFDVSAKFSNFSLKGTYL